MKSALPLIQRTLQTSRLVGAVAVIACVAFGSLLVASSRIGASSALERQPIPPQSVENHVPDATTLRFVSLGHHEAVADLMWLNALSFFGKYFGVRKDASWLWPHLDAVTTLDPNFALVYEWAGTVVMYGQEITNDTVHASNEVLERGVERFPLRWELWLMLGVNYSNELRPSSPEEAAEWRDRGAEAFSRAASLPGAPWFLRGTALSVSGTDRDVDATARVVDAALLAPSSEGETNSMRGVALRRLPTPLRLRVEARAEAADRLLNSSRWPFSPSLLALAVLTEPLYVEGAPEIDSTRSLERTP